MITSSIISSKRQIFKFTYHVLELVKTVNKSLHRYYLTDGHIYLLLGNSSVSSLLSRVH